MEIGELSIDSNESTSPTPVTPPVPAKAARQREDSSSSSSSLDLQSLPPAKPPRHFSLYKSEHYEDLIEQTDQIVKRVLSLVESFGSPGEREKLPSLVTMRVSPQRPLMFVSSESSAKSRLNIVTSNSTPTFTSSIRVSRTSTTLSSASEDECHSSATLLAKTSLTSLETGNSLPSTPSAFEQRRASSPSLTDDTQSFYSALPSSSTSPSYVSALSTFDTSGTTTPSRLDASPSRGRRTLPSLRA